uniref:Cytochrome c oxidase subunit 5B, mitochondrial n=1 Tax=Elaeophora elaphi TaxID=1147741 RepID=A0A0R3RK12_9BILA
MAQLCAHKLFTGLTRNTAALRAVTMCLERPYAKVASPEDYGHYTDPLEAHEESMKRRQLVATLAGDDRYETKVYYKLENSSPENPNLVPSDFDYRLLACFCEPDTTFPVLFVVHEGEPQRCRCGHWFKLIDQEGADHV